MEMKTEYVLQLYRLAVEEMRKYADVYHARIIWFTSILTAVLAATIAGLLKATNRYEYAIMIVGPLLIIGITRIARHAIDHCYEVFLISVTVRAKYEQLLGLTNPPHYKVDTLSAYWINEPLVASKHIESRKDFHESSEKWIKARLKGGDQTWTNRFFMGGEIAGWLLIIAIGVKIYSCG
jgi:hypothetical protein